MKIKSLTLSNFRGYKEETTIEFKNGLTTIIGKNDAGKSTILQALDIFFNDKSALVCLDEKDKNIFNRKSDMPIRIIVEFIDLPNSIVIDSSYETSLKDEFLLTEKGTLKIIKESSDGKKITSTFIECYHPNDEKCKNLLLKKNKELKDIIDENNIECENKSINAIMRKAIWKKYNAIENREVQKLDVTKKDSDLKTICDKLVEYMPVYSLFQSDRKNDDNDEEVQNPLKVAVKVIMDDEAIKNKLNDVAKEVIKKLQEVSDNTFKKLKEMDEKIAQGLKAEIPESKELKWTDVFKKVTIFDNDGIPINKRGSGVKRLILLNFFRAQAESMIADNKSNGIIYAIEEPETSQHIENQRILIDAFRKMLENSNIQIIITTHSGYILKLMEYDELRLIVNNNNESKICDIKAGVLPYVSLNEINYTTFNEIEVGYFNELYGYIEEQNLLADFENGKPKREYIRKDNGNKYPSTVTHIIRDQIHHPENKLNPHYTDEELESSIEEMRNYIKSKNS